MSNLYQAKYASASTSKDGAAEGARNMFQAQLQYEQENPTSAILKQEDVHNLLQAHIYKKQNEPKKDDHKPHNLYQARMLA